MRHTTTIFIQIVALVGAFCVLQIAGCNHLPKVRQGTTTPAPVSPGIDGAAKDSQQAAKDVDGVSSTLGKIRRSIADNTGKIDKKDTAGTMDTEVAAIGQELTKVDQESAKLTQVASNLRDNQATLKAEAGKAKTLENGIEKRDNIIVDLDEAISKMETDHAEEVANLNEELNTSARGKLMYAVLLGLAIFAVSVMMMINGNGKALGFGIGGLVLSITALTFSYFLVHIQIIGGLGLLIVLGFVGYKIYEQYHDKKAHFEQTKAIEHIKEEYLNPDQRKKAFGGLVGDGTVGTFQSEATKARVRDDRRKLGTHVAPIIRPAIVGKP